MGYCYSLLYFIHNMNYLPFPIIQVNYHLSITLCQNLVELKLHWLHLINSRFDQQNLGLKTQVFTMPFGEERFVFMRLQHVFESCSHLSCCHSQNSVLLHSFPPCQVVAVAVTQQGWGRMRMTYSCKVPLCNCQLLFESKNFMSLRMCK